MERIEEGDNVIIYEGPSRMNLIRIFKGKTYQNQYGMFYHDDMIGCCFGSVVSHFFDVYCFERFILENQTIMFIF
jgi:tRNA A58 N-methylase Trm61